MINLDNQIKSQNIIYVTRDIERALGIKPSQENGYRIISNWSEYAEKVASNCPSNFLLIKEDEMLDTWKLLEHKDVQDFIKKSSNNPKILVFKNTSKIEEICAKNSWELLNPKSELANIIENKITQIEWLGDLSSLLPEHKLQKAGEIEWNNPGINGLYSTTTGEGKVFAVDNGGAPLCISTKINCGCTKCAHICITESPLTITQWLPGDCTCGCTQNPGCTTCT